MLGRKREKRPADTLDSLAAAAAAVAESRDADRARLVEIDETIEASVDVDEREALRDERTSVEARIDDAYMLHEDLIGRRDRLERELSLAALDPLREKVAAREARAAALRNELAEIDSAVATSRLKLADEEDAILNPTLLPGEEQEVRWLVQQWRSGADVAGHLGRASRRVQMAATAKMEAIAGGVPVAVAGYRKRARQSFEEAGTPHSQPLPPIDVPAFEIPDPVATPPGYAKFG